MNLNLDFIYWGSVCEWLKAFMIVFCLIALGIGIGGIIISLCNEEKIPKIIIATTIIGFVLCIVTIFIPSKDFIYAKGIAENISNNEEVIGNAVETTIDKIMEAVNSKEDD